MRLASGSAVSLLAEAGTVVAARALARAWLVHFHLYNVVVSLLYVVVFCLVHGNLAWFTLRACDVEVARVGDRPVVEPWIVGRPSGTTVVADARRLTSRVGLAGSLRCHRHAVIPEALLCVVPDERGSVTILSWTVVLEVRLVLLVAKVRNAYRSAVHRLVGSGENYWLRWALGQEVRHVAREDSREVNGRRSVAARAVDASVVPLRSVDAVVHYLFLGCGQQLEVFAGEDALGARVAVRLGDAVEQLTATAGCLAL